MTTNKPFVDALRISTTQLTSQIQLLLHRLHANKHPAYFRTDGLESPPLYKREYPIYLRTYSSKHYMFIRGLSERSPFQRDRIYMG